MIATNNLLEDKISRIAPKNITTAPIDIAIPIESLRQKQYGPTVFTFDAHINGIRDNDGILFIIGVLHRRPKRV